MTRARQCTDPDCCYFGKAAADSCECAHLSTHAGAPDAPPECPWVQDGDAPDTYDTGCGKRFTITDGTPFDNDMTFCCYCGDPIVQGLYTPETDNDD